MLKHPEKRDFPVSQMRRYLEPGPIVLVSSRWAGQSNIMTLGWHTVLEFTPSLVGCMIADRTRGIARDSLFRAGRRLPGTHTRPENEARGGERCQQARVHVQSSRARQVPLRAI